MSLISVGPSSLAPLPPPAVSAAEASRQFNVSDLKDIPKSLFPERHHEALIQIANDLFASQNTYAKGFLGSQPFYAKKDPEKSKIHFVCAANENDPLADGTMVVFSHRTTERKSVKVKQVKIFQEEIEELRNWVDRIPEYREIRALAKKGDAANSIISPPLCISQEPLRVVIKHNFLSIRDYFENLATSRLDASERAEQFVAIFTQLAQNLECLYRADLVYLKPLTPDAIIIKILPNNRPVPLLDFFPSTLQTREGSEKNEHYRQTQLCLLDILLDFLGAISGINEIEKREKFNDIKRLIESSSKPIQRLSKKIEVIVNSFNSLLTLVTQHYPSHRFSSNDQMAIQQKVDQLLESGSQQAETETCSVGKFCCFLRLDPENKQVQLTMYHSDVRQTTAISGETATEYPALKAYFSEELRWRSSTKRWVVVKQSTTNRDHEVVEEIQAAVEKAKKLQHVDGIARPMELLSVDPVLVALSESNIAPFVQSGRSVTETIKLLSQVARTLESLHKQGYIYRDLCMSCMVLQKDRVLLTKASNIQSIKNLDPEKQQAGNQLDLIFWMKSVLNKAPSAVDYTLIKNELNALTRQIRKTMTPIKTLEKELNDIIAKAL